MWAACIWVWIISLCVVSDQAGRHFPLALRAGSSIDTDAKANVACGVGWYGFKNIFLIEFAYAYNNFPEVDQEFGQRECVDQFLAGL